MPRRVRPILPPEWHVPNVRREWITWKHASEKLGKEKVYWVSTASLKGRPHAAPVWGVWRKNRFYFETDPRGPKGRNLKSNPRIVVHCQDGWDTVIMRGIVEREKNSRKLALLKRDFARKYHYTPDWSDEKTQIVLKVTPRLVHAWKAPRMHRSLVNFIF